MNAYIPPTIGRVLLLNLPHPQGHAVRIGTPLCAQIAFVNEDGTINIGFLDHEGRHQSMQNVPLVQDGDTEPGGPFLCWMPVQIGQAKYDQQRNLAMQSQPLGLAVGAGNAQQIPAGVVYDDSKAAWVAAPQETKQYTDGSSATGTAPLPEVSPEQQQRQQTLVEKWRTEGKADSEGGAPD